MVPTFVVLSCGYLLASRKEVDSVELPYLNRARLAYTATKFLGSGGCWRHCRYCELFWLTVESLTCRCMAHTPSIGSALCYANMRPCCIYVL
jgi:hypothetical protein